MRLIELCLLSLLSPQEPVAPSAHSSAQSTRAQRPHLHAAIAASQHRDAVPAIAWLCEDYLPGLSSWPPGLDPLGPLSLTLSQAGIQVSATEVTLPQATVAVGVVALTNDPTAPALLWRCGLDGEEEWLVQSGFSPPTSWTDAIAMIGADELNTPRSLAIAIATGHLYGSLLEGDPRAPLLRICPSLCGDVSWLAQRCDEGITVRGQSGGGMMLPLTLLLAAVADGSAEPTSLQLRAFAARDGDQAEACRQLGRDDRGADTESLRALLAGDDVLRMTAIHALTRRRAAAELPHIINAAAPDMPWATLAARDAVLELWRLATTRDQGLARQSLRRQRCAELRTIDVNELAAANASERGPARPDDRRSPAFAVLFCAGLSLLGLWRRARISLKLKAS